MNKRNREELERQCSFQPMYSGDDSERFWSTVRRSPNRTLYVLGCALQDLEGRVLREVNEAVHLQVAEAIRKSAAKKPRPPTR